MIWSEGSRPVWGECDVQQKPPLSLLKRPAARKSNERGHEGEEEGREGEGEGGGEDENYLHPWLQYFVC